MVGSVERLRSSLSDRDNGWLGTRCLRKGTNPRGLRAVGTRKWNAKFAQATEVTEYDFQVEVQGDDPSSPGRLSPQSLIHSRGFMEMLEDDLLRH